MLLIIMDHYVTHGLMGHGSELGYCLDRYIAGISITGGYGNDIFILIAGYYMSQSRFTARKLAKLWGEAAFYSMALFSIFYVLNRGGLAEVFSLYEVEFGVEQVAHAILPIGYSSYWFATCYVVLMMLSPLLNIVLDHFSKKQLLYGLAIATIFWSIMPILINTAYYSSELTWFCMLYLYAGYIQRYVSTTGDWKHNAVLALFAYLIGVMSVVCMIYVGHVTGSERLINQSVHFVGHNSPIVLLFAIEIFLVTIKIRARTNVQINAIASATFGVYLVHNNYYIKIFLWKYLLGLPESVYDTGWLVPHMLLSVLAVYAICMVIDFIRQCTVERIYMRLVDHAMPSMRATYHKCIGLMAGVIDKLTQ